MTSEKAVVDNSRSTFKNTVALIVRNKLEITPVSYQVWYNYIKKTDLKLNSELDEIVAKSGRVSMLACEEICNRYFSGKAEQELSQFKNAISKWASETNVTMASTMDDTVSFEKTLDETLTKFANIADESLSMQEVAAMMKEMVIQSKRMKASTSKFKYQLEEAHNQVHRLESSVEDLKKEVLIDSLTSLSNRRAFDKDLGSLLASKSSFSISMIDIDYFKSFNDEYGHLMGDKVLKIIAERLKKSGINGVKAYRFGGEEFVLLLTNMDSKMAKAIAESLRKSIEKINVRSKKTNEKVKRISASFGVTQRSKVDTVESIIERADKLLYMAKEKGRNTVVAANAA